MLELLGCCFEIFGENYLILWKLELINFLDEYLINFGNWDFGVNERFVLS